MRPVVDGRRVSSGRGDLFNIVGNLVIAEGVRSAHDNILSRLPSRDGLCAGHQPASNDRVGAVRGSGGLTDFGRSRHRARHRVILPESPAAWDIRKAAKLHRQVALFGSSSSGMPAPWVYRGSDGELQLYNGVTRATRIAKLTPGTLIRVEVVGDLAAPVGHLPTIGDLLP